MKYTNKLGLPIWDNPETDVFDIGEFNKGNKIVDDIVVHILKQNQTTKEEVETINSQMETIATKVYVTYEEFGAKLDGITDDFEAINKCHIYANEHKLDVKQKRGKIFFTKSVYVNTSLDLNGAELVMNNNNIGKTLYVFNPLNDFVEKTDITQNELVKGETIINSFSTYPNSLIYIESDELHGYRGGNQKDPWYKKEMITHSRDGMCMSGKLLNDFTEGNIRTFVREIDNTLIEFKCPKILYEITDNTKSCRLATIRRDNVTVTGLDIYIKNDSVGGNTVWKGELILFEKCFNIKFKNFNGSNITGGLNNWGSGYIVNAYFINRFYFSDINIDSSGWGFMGTHYIKDFTIRDSTVNRIDCHVGLYNMTVDNCNVHHSGITIPDGDGVVTINNCKIMYDEYKTYKGIFVLRTDFGSMFRGKINISNIKIINRTNSEIELFAIWTAQTLTSNNDKIKIPDIEVNNIIVESEHTLTILNTYTTDENIKDVYLPNYFIADNIYNINESDVACINGINLKTLNYIKTDSECNFILKNINRKRYNKIDKGYTTDELVNGKYLTSMTKKMLFNCDNTGGHELSYNVSIYNSYGSLLSKNINTNINIKNSSINMLNCGDKTEVKAKNIDIRDSEIVGYPTPYATATGNSIISTNLKAYNNIYLSIIKDNVKIPPTYGHDGLIISLNNVSYDVSEEKDRFLNEVNI